MTEKTFNEDQIKPTLIILYVLGFVHIIYALLLFLLERFAFDPASTPANEMDGLVILPPVFAAFSVLIIIVVIRFMIPMVETSEDYNDVFPKMLITSVLTEVIGMFGLLIGLLDVFARNVSIRWEISGPFLIVAFLIQFYLVQKKFTPKLRELIGTTYTQHTS